MRIGRWGRGRGNGSNRGNRKIRLAIAVVLVVISCISYFGRQEINPVTGEKQKVSMSPREEIALGIQAAPRLVQQHKGEDPRDEAQAQVDQVGARLLQALNQQLAEEGKSEQPYPFEFTLLADGQVINAFALPGGQVFITRALFDALTVEDQLAGVIAHEIGHVLSRHGAQQVARGKFLQGLTGAAGVAAGDQQSAQMARMVGQLINMKYGRNHELESDRWAVRLMLASGYKPEAMIEVMKVLEAASKGGPPEFMSTHPKPANRVAYIEELIREAQSR